MERGDLKVVERPGIDKEQVWIEVHENGDKIFASNRAERGMTALLLTALGFKVDSQIVT